MTTTRTAASIFILRLAVLVMAALGVFGVSISTAHAQAANCAALSDMLNTLDRNQDFQNSQSGNLRQIQRQVQRAESTYVRAGCNDDAKAGRPLSQQCQAMARDVLDLREQVAQMSQSVDTGQAVAQQREAILQEMARFDCGNGRSRLERQPRNGASLFERLFGGFTEEFDGEGGIRGDEFNPYGNYHTVRTLCVRKTDGFYWPISYSTLVDYVANDAEQCRAMCPGLDVDMYYYDNPGQEPAQAINQWGEPYTNLPNAFRFRNEFDTTAKCNSTMDQGAVQVAQLANGGTRAMVTFRGDTFPLPIRDARRGTQPVATAPLQVAQAETFVDVPLPRRRPSAPGQPVPTVQAVTPAPDQAQRVVMFGDKRVRIVGPETPYAQAVAAGT